MVVKVPHSLPSAVTTADKVSFLSAPENLRQRARRVEVLETHYAWLFLTERLVYKFKKAIQGPRLDYRSLAVRRAMCEREVQLNRRLAPQVYIGAEPLTINAAGTLVLGGSGTPAEWLVKMRRLPSSMMMNAAIASGQVSEQDITRVALRLSEFYARATVAPIGPEQYIDKLTDEILVGKQVLLDKAPVRVRETVPRITQPLLDYIEEHSAALEDRVNGYYLKDCHGDLRPEHVCLLPELPIIDCIEFDEALRYLDCLEEIAFLGMESRILGAVWIEESLLRTYRRHSDDTFPEPLAAFYAARRAFTRATLMVWRANQRPDSGHSMQRAVAYLALLDEYLLVLA